MTESLYQIGAVAHALPNEGATDVWSDMLVGVDQADQFKLKALALHEKIDRDGETLTFDDARNYHKLIGAEITVSSGERAGAVADFMAGLDLVTMLEEKPLSIMDEVNPDAPIVMNLFRSAEFRDADELARLRSGLDSGRVAAVTVDSDTSKASYLANGFSDGEVQVIHNGIDTDRFVPSDEARVRARTELEIDQEAQMVLLIGRDSYEKDIPLFLRSANSFLKSALDAHVVVIGTGLNAENPNYQAQLDEVFGGNADILNRIHSLGRRGDIPDFYAAADVLALTSLTESRPLCVNEAQAAGVPVAVSTDVGDAASMIGEHGLITGRDPEEIADAWQEAFARRHELAFPIENRDSLGLDEMISKYRSIYADILA